LQNGGPTSPPLAKNAGIRSWRFWCRCRIGGACAPSLGHGLSEAGRNALIGTPDEIAGRLELLRAVGVAYVLLSGQGSRDNLRRFARDIMPAFAG
jgi:hypothetical protein